MNTPTCTAWNQLKELYFDFPEIPLALDLSRMGMTRQSIRSMQAPMNRVFDAMNALEAGAMANPDETREVGHYWLRNSSLAPREEYRLLIEGTLLDLKNFAQNNFFFGYNFPATEQTRKISSFCKIAAIYCNRI